MLPNSELVQWYNTAAAQLSQQVIESVICMCSVFHFLDSIPYISGPNRATSTYMSSNVGLSGEGWLVILQTYGVCLSGTGVVSYII